MELINKKLNRLHNKLNRLNVLKTININNLKYLEKNIQELIDKIVELDNKGTLYYIDEIDQLTLLTTTSTEMTYITCTDAPPVITTDNETTYYKWTQFSKKLVDINQPSGTININFTYQVNGEQVQYKKKSGVNSQNVIYVTENELDHIKIPVDWFPASQACDFGFQITISSIIDGVDTEGTYHFASNYPETG